MALRKFLYMSAAGYSQEQATSDEISLAKVTVSGLTGVGIDAGGNKVVGVSTPTSTTDAANKAYVDQAVLGIEWKQNCRVATTAALPAVTAAGTGVGKTLTENANGALSVDGISPAVGERVLVKNQVAGADNGIYVVTATGSAGAVFVLTRATDFDENAEVLSQTVVPVSEGSTNADTMWMLTTNAAITVDTTSLSFTAFGSGTSVVDGAGILKTGSTLAVELDTAAAAQSAGSSGGNSGLEFDTTGDNGKLRAAVNATGGLQRTSTGLGVLVVTANNLTTGASGLDVAGVPSTFKINGSATSANVTAANLGTLTAGTASGADALHTHNSRIETMTANAAIASAKPVTRSSTNNRVDLANTTTDAAAQVIGLTVTSAAGAGNTLQVVRDGPAAGVLSAATANTRYYLANGGGLTTTRPATSGDRVISMGFAINATDLDVIIQDFGKIA